MRRAFALGFLVLVSACDSTDAPIAPRLASFTATVAAGDSTPAALLPGDSETITLAELAHPERFAWPARFTCYLERKPGRPLEVFVEDLDDMTRQLLALDVIADDCRGGFILESIKPRDDKLHRIIGEPAEDAAGA